MKSLYVILCFALFAGQCVMAQQSDQSIAFPGAEGFGRYTTGGRGGKVYHVTTLKDGMEEGTLRHAIAQKGTRTIVFDVAGTIFLNSRLSISHGDLTIAGQTAPGQGICIARYPVTLNADNVIVRYVRFRVGNEGRGEPDGFGGSDNKNIIVDHCSISWSVDETCTIYGNENTTVQWCLISESLRSAGHGKGKHGYGGIVGGDKASFHHNLMAHHESRVPRLGPRVTTQEREYADMRNNVLYNWAGQGCYGGEGMKVNIVNNYYKPGPATPKEGQVRYRITALGIRTKQYVTRPDGTPNAWAPMLHVWGRLYVDGNVIEGNEEVTKDNWTKGIYEQIENSKSDGTFTAQVKKEIRLSAPLETDVITTHTAKEAYELVLKYAGCSKARDIIDTRIVEETRTGTATYYGSISSDARRLPGLIDLPDDVKPQGAASPWPELSNGGVKAADLADADADGMPDTWESAHGLQPLNAADGNATTLSGGTYTNLEVYLNSLAINTHDISSPFHAVVAQDGSGDHTTIQSAIDAAPSSLTEPWLIFVKNGSYQEQVVVPARKTYIHLIGQDKDKTIIHHRLNVGGKPEDTSDAGKTAFWKYSVHNPESEVYKREGSVVKVYGHHFYSENISYVNDWGVDAQGGPQALAMNTQADCVAFYNCNFRSFQDTWMTSSRNDAYRHYVKECRIEGAVDYFYGGGDALLENCTLYNVRSGSVIVAPSHKNAKFGYVFRDCVVDGNQQAADGKQKLGRPWHNSPVAVYINTTMRIPVAPEGWTNMGAIPALFAEYNSRDVKGNLIDLSGRKTQYEGRGENAPTGSCRATISKEEADGYTYERIIPGSDGWNPRAMMEKLSAPGNIRKNGKTINWNEVAGATGYIIFSGEQVIGLTKEPAFTPEGDTSGEISICAVNHYGSLGKLGKSGSAATTQHSIYDRPWTSVATSMPAEWYAGDEAKVVAENVLLFQRKSGGWPKNIPMQRPLSAAQRAELAAPEPPTKSHFVDGIAPTFDNGATITEMRFMANMYTATKDKRYRASFERGLDYLLAAQYANGGWPQFYPLRPGYYTHITYNDNAMVNVLRLLWDIADRKPEYSFVATEEVAGRARKAFDKGIDCILRTQIIIDGKPTVWCAQHDEVTLLPAKARAYELPSFSGSESAGITLLLMDLPNPSPEVTRAIKGAVQWFEAHKIEGIKLERQQLDGKWDRVVVSDSNAPAMWARFYDLQTGKPFFCGRDGVKRTTLAEIEHERRNGYSWYTSSPQRVLERSSVAH